MSLEKNTSLGGVWSHGGSGHIQALHVMFNIRIYLSWMRQGQDLYLQKDM